MLLLLITWEKALFYTFTDMTTSSHHKLHGNSIEVTGDFNSDFHQQILCINYRS